MDKKPAVLLGVFLCAALWQASFAQQASGPPSYKDPSLPLEQRVNDLVSRMTLEEKVSQLTACGGCRSAAGHTGVQLVE